MKQEISRAALYRAVWSAPIKTVAERYAITDVALAKVCRKHGIPIPPRGHWAKVQAAKPVVQPRLLLRALGMPDSFHLGRAGRWGRVISDEELIETTIPPPPVFSETVGKLVKRVERLVGRVTPIRDLHAPHSLIAGLLRRDEVRRKKYSYLADRPLFSSPFEQRRLCLLNAIFYALERCGARGALSGNDPSEFGACIGEQYVSFSLDHPKNRNRIGYRGAEDMFRPASEPLKLRIVFSPEGPCEVRTTWEDQPASRLEARLSEIVVGLIVCGELRYRLGEAHQYLWLVERRARAIEEARQRKEEEARQAKERQIREEKARVDRLLGQAEALRQARDIRAYVESVRSVVGVGEAAVSEGELSAWVDWALAQADRIDPVRSAAFLAVPYDGNGAPPGLTPSDGPVFSPLTLPVRPTKTW